MFQLLIVDDESAVVDSLSDTLPWESIGITSVFKAYSGFEALDILKTNTIDILITDIHMPGMSGLELLAKAHRSWKKMKSILLSGHAEFDYARQAIRHNTYEYLLKPVSDETVLSKVGALVQLLQKEREELLSYQLVLQAFEESLPKLRGELLNDLLQGLELAPRKLQEKMELLKVSMGYGAEFVLLLVRMEGKLSELDLYNLSLMEYAVNNMTTEIFEDGFCLWPCKDIHGFLVFLVSVKERKKEETPESESADQQLQQLADSSK